MDQNPVAEIGDFKKEVWSIGVDWITCTQEHGESLERIRAQCLALADVELQSGMFGRPWSSSGYEGFSVGHLEYGERADGCIAQLHGVLSHAHWKRLYDEARNCSRIDLEVTIPTTRDPKFVLTRLHSQMERKNRTRKKPWELEIRKKQDGAITIYSGAPSSDVRLRIYDKGRESGLPQFWWSIRFELQLRRKKSLFVSSRLVGCPARAAFTLRSVLSMAVNRGCRLSSLLKAFGQTVSLETLRTPGLETDADRRVKWLDKSVRPCLQHLIELKGEELVMRALGFPSGRLEPSNSS